MKTEFKYLRFDPQGLPIEEVANFTADRFATKAHLSVDDELIELVRLYISQKKKCNFCIILHDARCREMGIANNVIAGINAYHQSELYSEELQAALRYSDVLVDCDNKKMQEAHDDLLKYFTKEQVIDISSAVLNMIFFVHYKLATGEVAVK